MIDVESDIFDYVYPFVENLVPSDCFRSTYVPNPPAFPFATLTEIGNVTTEAARSSSMTEEYATVTYEANVYATDKFQCRKVMNAIDTALTRLNFSRMSVQFIPNLADSSIFRYIARYRAIAGADKVMYRT